MAEGLVRSLTEVVDSIDDGTTLYLGGAVLRRKPMALVRALVSAERRNLHVMTFAGSVDIDMLVGAGCVSVVSSAFVGLGALGFAPAFKRAVEEGTIEDREYSEWTMLAGLRAAAMGIPFVPTRGGSGSQLLDHLHPKEVEDPYGTGSYLAIPPIRPDVAIIHAWRASPDGAVQMAWPPEHLWDVDVVAARAADRAIVSVDEIVAPSVVAEQAHLTVLNAADVDVVVEAPGGAWPTAGPPDHPEDHEAVAAYARSTDLADLMPGVRT